MRIATLHGLGPGGALNVVRDSVAWLSERHTVGVFRVLDSLQDDGLMQQPATETVHIRLGRGDRLGLRECLVRARAHANLAARVNEWRPDVVLAHPDMFFQAPPAILKISAPTVYYMHEVRRTTYEAGYRHAVAGNALRRALGTAVWTLADKPPAFLDRRATLAAQVRLANSVFTTESVRRAYGVASVPCPPGVDSRRFSLSPDTSRENSVLLVGGLEQNKGAGLLLRALRLMKKQNRPRVVVTGQRVATTVVRDLRDLAIACDADLEIRIDVTDSELIALYRAALATCCLSRLEPFGLTAVESMLCGTPVVAVREGGFCETVVDGQSGLLVERTERAVADALLHMVAQPPSPSTVRSACLPRLSVDAFGARLEQSLTAAVRPA